MRILLDTNIIISGFLSAKGPPGQLLQAWLDGRFDLVTSQTQLDELQRALGYDRLHGRVSPEQVRDFVDNIDVMAVVISSAGPRSWDRPLYDFRGGLKGAGASSTEFNIAANIERGF